MMWGVTTFFNPYRTPALRRNYLKFRKNLAIPLIAAELSFDGTFELADTDAEIVLRFRARDVLWHKERLFNLALGALPGDCDTVALLDCDVLFENRHWHEQSARLLQRSVMVQPFAIVGTTVAPPNHVAAVRNTASVAFRAATEGRVLGPAGHAWVFRRGVLERFGVYECCVIGGGDRLTARAAYGHTGPDPEGAISSPAWAAHYARWAKPFARAVDGRVDCVGGRLIALWHGEIKARAYRARHYAFKVFQFDPERDVRVCPEGCWAWASPKHVMHAWVRGYFRSRVDSESSPRVLDARIGA